MVKRIDFNTSGFFFHKRVRQFEPPPKLPPTNQERNWFVKIFLTLNFFWIKYLVGGFLLVFFFFSLCWTINKEAGRLWCVCGSLLRRLCLGISLSNPLRRWTFCKTFAVRLCTTAQPALSWYLTKAIPTTVNIWHFLHCRRLTKERDVCGAFAALCSVWCPGILQKQSLRRRAFCRTFAVRLWLPALSGALVSYIPKAIPSAASVSNFCHFLLLSMQNPQALLCTCIVALYTMKY